MGRREIDSRNPDGHGCRKRANHGTIEMMFDDAWMDPAAVLITLLRGAYFLP